MMICLVFRCIVHIFMFTCFCDNVQLTKLFAWCTVTLVGCNWVASKPHWFDSKFCSSSSFFPWWQQTTQV